MKTFIKKIIKIIENLKNNFKNNFKEFLVLKKLENGAESCVMIRKKIFLVENNNFVKTFKKPRNFLKISQIVTC